MGGKKKKTGGKGKKEDEEDLSVEQFFRAYKKKIAEYQCDYSKILKEKMYEFEEEGEPITKFHFWEELGWHGVKAIMEALKQVNYPHCRSIRLWKTYCEDEGVRAICSFIEAGKGVSVLELLDNKISALGCEFISKALHPKAGAAIMALKLDHNDIGSQGMINLAHGLSINRTIITLSLTYCNIDQDGARALFEILIYSQSQLEELNLSGNHLRNEGIPIVLRGVSIAKSLKKIYLADNQFSDVPETLDAFRECMSKNKKLGKYDIKFNNFSNEGIAQLTEHLKEAATHVFEFEISERVDKETLENFREQLKNNKPKKGKKKGKKKKKA